MEVKFTQTPETDGFTVHVERKHPGDAGADLYAVMPHQVTIYPNGGHTFNTGIMVEIPEGYFGMVANRSSMGAKGFIVMGGIIDAGYRGEIKVMLRNVGNETHVIQPLDRIAQLIVIPCALARFTRVDNLTDTDRGANGFGSTGR